MDKVFLTGAGGFVGSRLGARLGERCSGLVRRAPHDPVAWSPVVGDLLEPDSWGAALDGVATVVHLAAKTGKAPAADHQRANVEGTECVERACRQHGVRRLIFVSTIAVTFEDLNRYPYAQSKLAAEKVVRDSGLDATIVRPTMVLGPGSPILDGLSKLASMPVCPVFGPGTAPVQPVHVDDLVEALERVLADPSLDGETLEIGGPARLPIESLLVAIRRSRRGSEGPMLHLPLPLVLPLLALGESVAFGLMPFTVGQIATFRFDGTADPGKLPPSPAMIGLEAMIEAAPAARESATAGTLHDRPADDQLAAEARVFGRLLTAGDAPPAAVAAYVTAHDQEVFRRGTPFQMKLARAAARGVFSARMADGYARLFDPYGPLRRKLVLMLAILECTPPTHRVLDAPVGGGFAGALLRLAGYGLRAVFCTALGTLVFLPQRFFGRGGG